ENLLLYNQCMIDLNKRKEEILKVIIDEYTLTAQPVSSQVINDKYFIDLSSATIRNEMMYLEKNGFISKYYSSSGRIPTLKGYQYYDKKLNNDIPTAFKQQLKDILSYRNLSIDEVIDKSIEIINNITSLPIISTQVYDNDLLRKIELVRIKKDLCLFIIITSSGKIIKKELTVSYEELVDDLIVCVNIFNDRLVDTPMKEIDDKIEYIKDVIRQKIKSHEYVIQEVVEKIFKNIDWTKTTVTNANVMTIHPELTDINKFQKILNLLNDVSIWKQIAYTHLKTGKTNISFTNDIGIDDLSIASTSIELNELSREISVIGPNRLTYSKVNSLLKFLKEEIEKTYNDEKK
ncbi:MAG: heat-inducible transcriptional repressor HrcA, partial [Mycoplasma sp.]